MHLLPDFLSLAPLSDSHLMSFTTSRCELLVTMVPFTCWGTNDMTEKWQWEPRGPCSEVKAILQGAIYQGSSVKLVIELSHSRDGPRLWNPAILGPTLCHGIPLILTVPPSWSAADDRRYGNGSDPALPLPRQGGGLPREGTSLTLMIRSPSFTPAFMAAPPVRKQKARSEETHHLSRGH